MTNPPVANRKSQVASSADSVLAALTEQVACFRKLSRLAELQHLHVQQEQTDQLLDVLNKRQDVLNQIGRLELLIGPVKKRWAEHVASLDAPTRTSSESLLAEARKLLAEITASDQNDALVLQQRKLSVGRQLGQANAAKQVNRTYATAAYGRKPSRMDVSR